MRFEQLVSEYYQDLYRFGLSLSGNVHDACDLVQYTFVMWARKGHQLRAAGKAKSWLFTTLYREFLKSRLREVRFPHVDMADVEAELPSVPSDALRRIEAGDVMEALGQIEEVFRAPLSLFYIGDHSYRAIAEILDVPIGTVMSRISRGKQQLRAALAGTAAEQTGIPLEGSHREINHEQR